MATSSEPLFSKYSVTPLCTTNSELQQHLQQQVTVMERTHVKSRRVLDSCAREVARTRARDRFGLLQTV